jgi:hypothetical protein
MSGFQFGVVNVIDDADGEAFGVLTFAGNGRHTATVFTSDTMAANVAVQLGTRHFYTSLGAGFSPGDDLMGTDQQFKRSTKRVGYSFGLGWRFPVELGRLESLDLEASGMNLYNGFKWDGDRPIVASLRLQAAVRLAPHLALYGGPGVNVGVGWSNRDPDVGFGFLQWTGHDGETTVHIYPGFAVGLMI